MSLGIPPFSRLMSVLSMLCLVALTACSNKPLELDLVPTELPKPAPLIQLPPPSPVNLQPLSWSECVVGFYCLAPNGMRAYLENQAELVRWMREASTRMDYYFLRAAPVAAPAS